MQPQGRKPKTYNFIDNHPPKGYKNWWADICNDNTGGERLKAKRLIENEIVDIRI